MKNNCRIVKNLQLEPLFNQWYVCLPMLAPVPSSMVLTNSYILIMKSYIEDPEEHMLLSKDLEMTGGPFINYQENRSQEIKSLLDDILLRQQHLIDFSCSISSLINQLEAKVNGYSLETEYVNVPNCLKGYVELTYDLSNKTSVRFTAPLLYKSKY